jgi:hypothetical protein
MLPFQQMFLLLTVTYLSLARAQDANSTIIQTCQTENTQVTVTVPQSTASQPLDVMFLIDDTGTFAKVGSQLANSFSSLLAELAATFPSVDFGYGVVSNR